MITWGSVLLKGLPLLLKAGMYYINKFIKKAELKDAEEAQLLQTIINIYKGASNSVNVSAECDELKKRLLAKKAEIDAKKAANPAP